MIFSVIIGQILRNMLVSIIQDCFLPEKPNMQMLFCKVKLQRFSILVSSFLSFQQRKILSKISLIKSKVDISTAVMNQFANRGLFPTFEKLKKKVSKKNEKSLQHVNFW